MADLRIQDLLAVTTLASEDLLVAKVKRRSGMNSDEDSRIRYADFLKGLNLDQYFRKSGDTISGEIKLMSGSALRAQVGSNVLDLMTIDALGNTIVGNQTNSIKFRSANTLTVQRNNVEYKLYSEFNKPTPGDLGAYTKGEVDGLLTGGYYGKTTIDGKLAAINVLINDRYTKAEVDAKDTAQTTQLTGLINDRYTKAQVDALFVTVNNSLKNVYTKAEIDKTVNDAKATADQSYVSLTTAQTISAVKTFGASTLMNSSLTIRNGAGSVAKTTHAMYSGTNVQRYEMYMQNNAATKRSNLLTFDIADIEQGAGAGATAWDNPTLVATLAGRLEAKRVTVGGADVLKAGDFGIGIIDAPTIATPQLTNTETGLYRVMSGTVGNPGGLPADSMLGMIQMSGSGSQYRTQLATSHTNNGRLFIRATIGNGYQTWKEFAEAGENSSITKLLNLQGALKLGGAATHDNEAATLGQVKSVTNDMANALGHLKDWGDLITVTKDPSPTATHTRINSRLELYASSNQLRLHSPDQATSSNYIDWYDEHGGKSTPTRTAFIGFGGANQKVFTMYNDLIPETEATEVGWAFRGGLESNSWAGAGGFADQYNKKAPFYNEISGNTANRSEYHPAVKQKINVRHAAQGSLATFSWDGCWSMGYCTVSSSANQVPQIVIQNKHNASTVGEKSWTFDPNNGRFQSPGDIGAGGNLYAGGARFDTSGNCIGTVWGSATSNAKSYIDSFVKGFRAGTVGTAPVYNNAGKADGGGIVLTGLINSNKDQYADTIQFRALQYMTHDGVWHNIY